MQQSIFLDILRKDFLPHSTILITSRQSATKSLHLELKEQISQHIEILGFTKDDIISYVQNVIEDEKVYKDFLQYLNYYPYIRGMMYVPLNAVIVTEVYKSSQQSSEKSIPTTVTELYTSLTKCLLLRYLHSHSKYGQQEWTLNDFSDLPKVLYKQFCHICEIALEGMIEDEFVFDDLPNDFNTLDLMQSVPELYIQRGTVVSYNFFHLTLQEYLAAVQISKLPVKEQIDFFKGNFVSVKDIEFILLYPIMETSTSNRESLDADPRIMMGMKMDTTPLEQEAHLPSVLPHSQLFPLTTRLPGPEHEMPGIAHCGKHTRSCFKEREEDLETAEDKMKVMGISSTPTASDIGHSMPQPQYQYGLSTVPSHFQLAHSPPHLPHTSVDNLQSPPPSCYICLETDITSTRFQKVLRFAAGLSKYKNIPVDSLQQLLLQQDREDVVNISLNSLHWLFEAQ